jgi:hypothetical protein
MKRYPILLIAWLAPLAARGATNEDLRRRLGEKLAEYCVPSDEKGCGSFRARYQGGTCYCGNPNYTRYNPVTRRCEIICPEGKVPVRTDVCNSVGFGGLLVKDF